MPSFHSFRSASLTALLVGSSASCDVEVLSTRAGEHVTYYWNADERRLCGGTVIYADRLAETMVAHYGMSLDGDTGPTVEYFWGVGGVGDSACPPDRHECVRATPTTRDRWRSSIYADRAIYPHELAHAVLGVRDHGVPVFVNEGLAVRWQSQVLGDEYAKSHPLLFDEAQLRAQIDKWAALDSTGDYEAAFSWFAALEVSFGHEKMADFMQSLGGLSSSDSVDEALRRTMGISLAQSVAIAANHPSVTFDDPVCEMEGVPTMQWAGAPIVIDQRGARCADVDVVNWYDDVISIFILEFPDDPVQVNVTVTGARRALLVMLKCNGGVASGQDHRFIDPNRPAREEQLDGRWVVSLAGDIDDDGIVFLPRVEFAPVQP
jgi:hypothetical protein